MNLKNRIFFLEQRSNAADRLVSVVVIPYEADAITQDQFVINAIERIGRPVLIVPDKAPMPDLNR